jgi:hypothetical protein
MHQNVMWPSHGDVGIDFLNMDTKYTYVCLMRIIYQHIYCLYWCDSGLIYRYYYTKTSISIIRWVDT